MTHPRLMILDEATEGLAPLVVAEIWRVIALIRDSGLSTLVVDRNVQQVLAHTDRAIVMEKGRVVLAGDSADLAADAASMSRYLGV
jgi:branched-chain amino acid transport system ATP-binding protein